MKNPGVPLTLEDLNDDPPRREVLQILHSLDGRRKAATTMQEKEAIKKEMIDMARVNGFEREVIIMLQISQEQWRLSQLISSTVRTA